MGSCTSKSHGHRASSTLDQRVINALQAINTHSQKLDQQQKKRPSATSFNRIILKFPQIKKAFMSIRKVFHEFDKDGNGTIDRSELKEAMNVLGAKVDDATVEEMFRESDMTKEGHLHFREFLLSIALGSVLQLFPALKAYEGIDIAQRESGGGGSKDKSGVVTVSPVHNYAGPQLMDHGRTLVEGLQYVLQAYLLFDADASGTIERNEVFSILKERNTKAESHTTNSGLFSQERWKELDWDSDGTITFKEFLYAFYSWVGMDEDDEDE